MKWINTYLSGGEALNSCLGVCLWEGFYYSKENKGNKSKSEDKTVWGRMEWDTLAANHRHIHMYMSNR